MQVLWLPFELHPEVPPEGIARASRFPPERLEEMNTGVAALAREVGLTMRPRARLVNSRMALATAEYAREQGAFEPVHRALFKLHWEGPGELDDIEELKRVGVQAGLDADGLERALRSGRYEDVLDANRREAMEVGINAVPAHVFGGRFLVVGAQPLEVYEQVLRQLEEAG